MGERLGLKALRCDSPKCAQVRRPFRPGMHGHKRSKRTLSDFGRQLKEKQKFKLSYGVDERGLRRLFLDAHRKTGSTAEELMRLLERRLDNVVFRLGFARSRRVARQLISHGHILVDARRVKSPGYLTQIGDIISIHEKSKSKGSIQATLTESMKIHEPPSWLSLDKEKKEGKMIAYPQDDDLKAPFEVSLLIESFSK